MAELPIVFFCKVPLTPEKEIPHSETAEIAAEEGFKQFLTRLNQMNPVKIRLKSG